MIYLVTNNNNLVSNNTYKVITIEESLNLLEPLKIVGLDTETLGTEIWKGTLVLLQLGNKEFQVVIDCTTIDIKLYKDYLESDRLFIIHNAKFDLRWLYKEHIVIKRVFDTFLAEKILYLGIPPGIVSLSLKACCDRYLNVYLDKSVRGKIYAGLTDEVIVYGATDVVYLEDIMNKQLEIIHSRTQDVALSIENEFVKVLAYIEFCGIKLDPVKWKAKINKDLERLQSVKEKLDKWVVDYVMSKNNKEDGSIIKYIDPREKREELLNNHQTIYGDGTGGPIRFKGDEAFVMIPKPSLFPEFNTGPQCVINWSSSKQVIKLFKELDINVLVKDKKTGKMKESVESKYLELQVSKSSIIPLYLEYSAAAKVVSSFGENFLHAINPITHRIHANFNQLMDTGRLSCGSGGKNSSNEDSKKTNDKSINIQQLPATEETRAAFIPEEGYMLIDCDYGDQEGHVFTELSNDKEWIKFYNDPNERDGHSFVAKMCFPDELDGIEEKDVKSKRKDLRKLAKSARFCFNYNGTAPTMAVNCNISAKLAEDIYNNYFKRFSGIASYFKKQKKDMWDRGYILISEKTGLRSYIYDWPILKGIERRKNSIENFWDIYKVAKESNNIPSEIPASVIQEIAKRFAKGDPIEEIATTYSYEVKKSNKVEIKYIDINEDTVYITVMKHLWKRKSASDNQSCNYPSQGTAAEMTKIAAIRYFNHLIKDNLIFKVLIPNDVHDELLIEAPIEIAKQEAEILSECMEYAANIFCKKVHIKAIPEIGTYWIH